MPPGIVDTTILVDILRGYPPAGLWLSPQTGLAITPIVWMETIAGAANKPAQARARNALTQFAMLYLTPEDFDWAIQQQMLYSLSYGVGITDCLIASVSHRLQVPLYTANLKHFVPLLGPLTQKPY